MNTPPRVDRETLRRATRVAEARLAYTARRPAPRGPDRQATDDASREVETLGR